jgi:hypothetical protein
MKTPKDRPAANFEVPDPAVAFRKLQGAAKRVMAVPKKVADAAFAKEKRDKKR